MAEAILKKLIAGREDAGQWRIESAGIYAVDGRLPAFNSKYVMEMKGMDIAAHQSQPVSMKLLQQFDLILTMENEHKRWLKSQYGVFADRVYMVSEMVDLNEDIPDPIGGELADYEETASMLERILTEGFERICKLAIYHQDI